MHLSLQQKHLDLQQNMVVGSFTLTQGKDSSSKTARVSQRLPYESFFSFLWKAQQLWQSCAHTF